MRTPLLPQRWVLFEYSSFDQFSNIYSVHKSMSWRRGRVGGGGRGGEDANLQTHPLLPIIKVLK